MTVHQIKFSFVQMRFNKWWVFNFILSVSKPRVTRFVDCYNLQGGPNVVGCNKNCHYNFYSLSEKICIRGRL